MTEKIQWQTIDEIFSKSMRCRKCFDQKLIDSAFIDVAQPRWIGPRYFKASTKVLIISLNPGAGNTPENQQANIPFRQILYDYRDGKKTRQDLFTFQRQFIQQWGTPPGRFVNFYMDGMKLNLDEVALANIAWCADKRNEHPANMLSQCFTINTGKLIQAIKPDVAILSGSNIHKYYSYIEAIVPTCHIVKTWHYAHREGYDAEQIELQRVKKEIAAAH